MRAWGHFLRVTPASRGGVTPGVTGGCHGRDTEATVAALAGGARPRAFLSNRQQAILRLVAEGLSNKQIAASLGIGERTVKTHLTSAMNNLGVGNRAHAAVAAVQRGLL